MNIDKFITKNIKKWVNENFGDFNTQMNPNASDQGNQSHPYGAMNMVCGYNVPTKQDIAGEDLKKPANGVSKIKDLKNKTDNILSDIKTTITDCETKDATAASFIKLIDLLKKPEIISTLEHIKGELEQKEQDARLYR